ncbi:MAG: DUF3298 and DUF4163 domain-containing protein [Tannerellaceae bacterium]|jgi:hypothetical protein|nr:DUF3298 and DUF4163 domain-containing protein [Tannerellaceae bacterium]
MKPLHSGLALALFAACFACANDGLKNNRIAFDDIRLHETYHLLQDSANPACLIEHAFIFPITWPDTARLADIQNFFVTAFYGMNYDGFSPHDASLHYLNAYLDKYRQLEADFIDDKEIAEELPLQAWFSYFEYRRDSILYNQNNLLSFAVYMSSYAGGAHGYATTSFYSLSLNSSEHITEFNLFVKGYEYEMADLIIKELCLQYGVDDPLRLEELGFFNVKEIFPNGNFFLNDSGITYAFNAYEIAAYVLGTIEVHIPYADFNHLLLPNSF